MNRTDSMIDKQALHIAARLMALEGMCRLDSTQTCKKEDPKPCTGCIKRFLRGKAKAELQGEGKL